MTCMPTEPAATTALHACTACGQRQRTRTRHGVPADAHPSCLKQAQQNSLTELVSSLQGRPEASSATPMSPAATIAFPHACMARGPAQGLKASAHPCTHADCAGRSMMRCLRACAQVLFILQKEKFNESLKFTAIKLALDFTQLFALVVNPAHGWRVDQSNV